MKSVSLLLIPLLAPSFLPAASLQARVEEIVKGHHGKVALFAKKLKTGASVAIDPDTPVPTASVIKLPILWETFRQIKEGQRALTDPITLRQEDQVTGSGILQFLSTPHRLTLLDAVTLMMIISDNTATNLVIDQVGLKKVNESLSAMGLKNTYLYKKVYKPAEGPQPPEQKRFGLGKTTARDMAMVMESIVNCDLKEKKLCEQMLDIMRNQQYRNMIPHYLQRGDTSEQKSMVADKVGQLNKVRNDVAVIFTKEGPIVVSAFTYDNQDESWTAENEAELLIAKVAKLIVETWAPAGLGMAEPGKN